MVRPSLIDFIKQHQPAIRLLQFEFCMLNHSVGLLVHYCHDTYSLNDSTAHTALILLSFPPRTWTLVSVFIVLLDVGCCVLDVEY